MADKEKNVNEVVSGITGALSDLGKGVVDLAKIGAGKAKETIDDYNSKNSGTKKDKKTSKSKK